MWQRVRDLNSVGVDVEMGEKKWDCVFTCDGRSGCCHLGLVATGSCIERGERTLFITIDCSHSKIEHSDGTVLQCYRC